MRFILTAGLLLAALPAAAPAQAATGVVASPDSGLVTPALSQWREGERGRSGSDSRGGWNDRQRSGDDRRGGWNGRPRGDDSRRGGSNRNDDRRGGDRWNEGRWNEGRNRDRYRNNDRYRHGGGYYDPGSYRGGYYGIPNYRDRSNDRRWDNGWRRDNRYNWADYRRQNRDIYRPGRYSNPYGNRSYSRFRIGLRVDQPYYNSRYWISDPWRYRLPPVWGSYRWVRYYDDVLLIDTRTGYVEDVIHSFFW